MLYAQIHLTLPAWVHEAVDTSVSYPGDEAKVGFSRNDRSKGADEGNLAAFDQRLGEFTECPAAFVERSVIEHAVGRGLEFEESGILLKFTELLFGTDSRDARCFQIEASILQSARKIFLRLLQVDGRGLRVGFERLRLAWQ